jgi:hypothetical protein
MWWTTITRVRVKANEFTVHLKGTTIKLKFRPRHGLYICNIKPLIDHYKCEVINVQTVVATNQAMFTKRQAEEAKLARVIKRDLGYASDKDMIEMINSGAIINLPITAQDVRNATAIFGPDVPSLKGKTVKMKPAIAKIEAIPRPLTIEQSLHADIMFVDSEPFLISVTTPLLMTMVSYLPTRAVKDVEGALFGQINTYKSENYSVRVLLSDNEGAVAKLTSKLNSIGIRVNPAGPGQHVPVVERKIKQIKERVRAHITTLPFILAHSLLIWLVYFCFLVSIYCLRMCVWML